MFFYWLSSNWHISFYKTFSLCTLFNQAAANDSILAFKNVLKQRQFVPNVINWTNKKLKIKRIYNYLLHVKCSINYLSMLDIRTKNETNPIWCSWKRSTILQTNVTFGDSRIKTNIPGTLHRSKPDSNFMYWL